MTWKQIEARRETRLWITQVILPLAGITTAALSIPEVRQGIKRKASEVKSKVKAKFNR